jgi:EmrB/QacA subfamily drug resistance transporter
MNSDRLRWWILITVIIGTFLGRLDQTIVSLALPKIIDDFGITVSQAGWIATAYILANAIFVPVWGKLGDTIGRKKVYIYGFSIFILGSILAGIAWNLNSMLLFRVIQAIAASADYPTAMAIIAVTFKAGRERTQALGMWSASFAAATVFGPLIGGPLIDTFGWRSVFIINLPIGLIGLLMAVMFIDESVSGHKTKRFDWWGSISLGIGLSALVLVLDRGIDWGWFSGNSIVCYAVIVFFMWLFIRIDLKHPEPIVDLNFFKNSAFVWTLVNNFIVFMGFVGVIFVVPIFVQLYLGYDATHTGYFFIPLAFCMFLSASIGGRLAGRVKSKYIIAISTAAAAVGIFLLGAAIDPRATAFAIIMPMSFMAFGMGFAMAQRTSLIASLVPESEVGSASSVLALARNIAGAFGIAVFATMITNLTESNLVQISKYSIVHATSPLLFKAGISLEILKAQINAYHAVFIVSGIILFIGAITSLFINVKEEKIVHGEEIMMD